MATLHAFYSSDYCSFFELQTGNPSEDKRFEDLPATITSKNFSPYYHILQSRREFRELIKSYCLTDCLTLIERELGVDSEYAIAFLQFTKYLGGHHA